MTKYIQINSTAAQHTNDLKNSTSSYIQNIGNKSRSKKSFQKAALFTLILLGHVAWISPSYGGEFEDPMEESTTLAGLVKQKVFDYVTGVKKTRRGVVLTPGHDTRQVSLEQAVDSQNEFCVKIAGKLNATQNAQAVLTEAFDALGEESNGCKIKLQDQNEKFERCNKTLNTQVTQNQEQQSLLTKLTRYKESVEMALESAKVGFYSSIGTELIKDGVKLAGYSEEQAKTVTTAATIIKGVATAYAAESYVSTLPGMLLPSLTGTFVSSGLTYCGVSAEKSVTAGSAAAVFTSFAQNYFYSPETFWDHAFAVGGYWAGSTLGIQAHDLAVGLASRARDRFFGAVVPGGPGGPGRPDDDSSDDSDDDSSPKTPSLTFAEALDSLQILLMQLETMPQHYHYSEEWQSAAQASERFKTAVESNLHLDHLTGELEASINDFNERATILISKI